MSYNLNPDRKTPYVVVDNLDEAGREGIYSGPYDDCIEFIAEQGIGMYDIVHNWLNEN